MQSRHAVALDWFMYRPGAQTVQFDAPASEKAPGEQNSQKARDWAPTVVEKLPAGHGLQVDDAAAPEAVEKVPGGQR